jgi:hypothetical protein
LFNATDQAQPVFKNYDVIHALLIIDGSTVTNGDKWTIDYVLESIPEEDDEIGDFYAIYLTLIPGSILFVVAFLVFELPYLAKKIK